MAKKMPDKIVKKKQFELEFIIRSSPHILYEFVSTPSGLSQWFADNVDAVQNKFKFIWGNIAQIAELVEKTENERVRFRWQGAHKEDFFQFKIEVSEISNDTVLIITDFAYPKDMKDQTQLWDSQVKTLIEHIGGLGI
jgi:uncharacterized protein YndB with AHSA1/START domain